MGLFKSKTSFIPRKNRNGTTTAGQYSQYGISQSANGGTSSQKEDLSDIYKRLEEKLDSNKVGTANGAASLDENGKVPTSQLPSYVDDVVEYATRQEFPIPGESGKIYIDTSTNKTYRWGGTTYVDITSSSDDCLPRANKITDEEIGRIVAGSDVESADNYINNRGLKSLWAYITAAANDIVTNLSAMIAAKQDAISVTTKSDTPTDNETVIMQANGSNDTKTFLRRKMSDVVSYFKNKFDAQYLRIGAFVQRNNSFGLGSEKISISKIDNSLYAADKRFIVTREIFNSDTGEKVTDQSISSLFDGGYEGVFKHPITGEYELITIKKDEDGSGSLWTYGGGYLYVSFYHTKIPDDNGVSIRWKYKNSTDWNSGTLTKIQTRPNLAVFYYELKGNQTYINTIEIKVQGKTNEEAAWPGVSVTEIEFIRNRATIDQESAVVKYGFAQEIYGSLTAPKFITKGGTSSQIHNGDGSLSNNLSVARGGTGATTAIGAEFNILNHVQAIDATLNDNRKIALCNETKSSTNGVFRWLNMSNVWNYIKGKIDSAYSAVLGSGITSGKVSSYDTHIADTWKHVTSEDKHIIEESKSYMTHFATNGNGSHQKSKMFSQYIPYSSTYAETRVAFYAVLRQETTIIGVGFFVSSYFFKGGEDKLNLYCHGQSGRISDIIKAKRVTNASSSQDGEVCLYADFGDLNNKSCSITYSVITRSSIDYVDMSQSDTPVDYVADYDAICLSDNDESSSTHFLIDDEDADFSVMDENGNVILELKGGHIRTQQFDSRLIAQTEQKSSHYFDNDDGSDFSISDVYGNKIVEFKDGHIRTKNFDSRRSGSRNGVTYENVKNINV